MLEKSISYNKDDVRKMSDEELLKLVRSAKGNTKTFAEESGCSFSYSFLTKELTRRGFECGWYRPDRLKSENAEQHPGDSVENRKTEASGTPVTIPLNERDRNKKRVSFDVDDDAWQRWQKATEGMPGKAYVLAAALDRFCADIKAGLVSFGWLPNE